MRTTSTVRMTPPRSKIEAEITVPGSKSYTNRALVMSAIAEGRSELEGISPSRDSEALIRSLEKLGVAIHAEGDRLIVEGGGTRPRSPSIHCDVGPAGTTSRFLASLLSLQEGVESRLSGSARLHERPIGALVEALRHLGATIRYEGREGSLPLRIVGKRLPGGKTKLDGSVSSQFFTSLLLVAPLFDDGLEIEVLGEQVSRSYLDMTISSMAAFGVSVENDHYRRYVVQPGARYEPRVYRVEGDGTGATYFWGLAAVSGGAVRVRNVSFDSAQGDLQFPKLLEKMGCSVRSGSDAEGAWIEVTGGELRGISADLSLLPDAAQTLAVVAAVAEGVTHLTGLATLRVKETDRLLALQVELEKVGIHSEATEDSLTIEGGTPTAAQIATYDDHRMAMSFALLGAVVNGMKIEEPLVVEKSHPRFWDDLKACGVGVSYS